MKTYQQLLRALENDLAVIKTQHTRVFDEIKAGITVCENAIEKIRAQVHSAGFDSKDEECLFFKTIKPTMVGYLIGYLKLVSIESGCPVANKTSIVTYLQSKIEELQSYFHNNQELYVYLQLARTDKDQDYFLRQQINPYFHSDSLQAYIDPTFTTPMDGIVATIKAHQWLIERMVQKLERFQQSRSYTCAHDHPTLQWTGSKVELVELIYALHTTQVCNRGQATLKDIADSLQQLFHLDVGDYYRTYLEIQIRKNSRTKFLDSLRDNLVDRMEETESL